MTPQGCKQYSICVFKAATVAWIRKAGGHTNSLDLFMKVCGPRPNKQSSIKVFSLLGVFLSLLPLLRGRAIAPALALAPDLAFAPASAASLAPAPAAFAVASAFAPALAVSPALAFALLMLPLLLFLLLLLLLLLCSKGICPLDNSEQVLKGRDDFGTTSTDVFLLLGACLQKAEAINLARMCMCVH